ncbi:single-stranded DNA-binding protein [Micromonospora sp. U56]|uniref:single-stranded DNA-binding protein n=1 Tax=Micromonospora sp. U56 TaxID=2824900 RepID=UPI0035A9554A
MDRTRVRVNCWRKLAEGVAASVMVGDPVVVAGRLYTRDWTDDAGNHRTVYELEAVAVGHDLSRGRGRFLRNKPTMATSTVEDAEAAGRVQGEPTEPVPHEQAPAAPDDRPFDEDFEFSGFAVPRASHEVPGTDLAELTDPFDEEGDDAPVSGDELTPVPGDDEQGAGEGELDAVPEETAVAPAGRGRRGRGRVPVPA